MSAVDNPVVSTEWLHEHLGEPHLRVLDCTWYLPGDPRDPKADFQRARIPGAQFFDIDAVSDRSNPLPHMVPSPEDFAVAVELLGVSDGDTVVAYHDAEMVSAPRVWWMFRLFGHSRVFVLDGGLRKWMTEGRPVEDGPAAAPPMGRYTPQLDRALLRHVEEVRQALDRGTAQVIDARPSARFLGDNPEPRPGVRAGHMPGAINLPAQSLIAADGTLLPEADLARAFANAGVEPDQPIVTSCGSGISACTVNLALARLGHWLTAVYDGSWTEWGSRRDTPVVTGP
jgi:thiosulfate/3-mercaptopyruvate sulfurtransferase